MRSVVSAIILIFCLSSVAESASWQTISPQRLYALVREGSGAWLVDLRNPALFEQGHIEGAVNIPVGQLKYKSLPKGKTIVLADDSLGLRHARGAADLLTGKGYEKVFILDGGIPAWEAEKLPVTSPRIDRLRPVSWDDFSWSRSVALPLRVYDLRGTDEQAKGVVEGALILSGKTFSERLQSLKAELVPLQQPKEMPGKLNKQETLVLVLPSSASDLAAARAALAGVSADIRYLDGAYPIWSAREKDNPLPGPEVCPTCSNGKRGKK